jgi:hypothetical protein
LIRDLRGILPDEEGQGGQESRLGELLRAALDSAVA